MGQTTQQDDKIVLATLRLHELYEGLHSSELKDHMEPYQPEVFLTALRSVLLWFTGAILLVNFTTIILCCYGAADDFHAKGVLA